MKIPASRDCIHWRSIMLILGLVVTGLIVIILSHRYCGHIDMESQFNIDADAIEFALESYRIAYDCLPIVDENRDVQNNKDIMTILQGNLDKNPLLEHNPRQIRFLHLPSTRCADDGTFFDPWKQPYHIAFDIRDNGILHLGPSVMTNGTVAIWSAGPNRIDEFGRGDDLIRIWTCK